MPNGCVEIGRRYLNDDEQANWQGGKDHGRGAAFGGQCANFTTHFKALTDYAGEIVENFGKIAASCRLDTNCRDEERQVLGTDAAVKVTHR